MIVRDLPELWRPDQDGHPCKAPAMPAGRCRVHGGADAPRAPPISGRIGHYSSSSTCLLLLIDHRRNRLRKLRPRSKLPSTFAMPPVTSTLMRTGTLRSDDFLDTPDLPAE
jgi:hypothetical protein